MDYIEINADLHMHGLYSGAVSSKMVPRVIGEQAPLKGLQLVGTADILNERWIRLIREQLKAENEIWEHPNGTKFILQTEVEDSNRVHHIILFPSMSKVYEMREKLKQHAKNLDTDGRPNINLSGEQIAELCKESECMIGFAHAFTPYFGMYGKFDSYKDCYGDQWRSICFMELGLSADTDMADRIGELHDLTFLSNSDAHSPWPNKLGREFNKLRIREVSFEEVKKALRREGSRRCTLNVGFNPQEGKYHRTRCTGCHLFFRPKEAAKFSWRCPACKRAIKKGVDFRIEELATVSEGVHPSHRPDYIHIIPLSEIIGQAIGIKNAWSMKVQDMWKTYIEKFGNEIRVLLEVPIEDIRKVNERTGELVSAFREGKYKYVPGGAGIYGVPVPPGRKAEVKYYTHTQKSISDF